MTLSSRALLAYVGLFAVVAPAFGQPAISAPPDPPPPPPRTSPPFEGTIISPLGEERDVLRMYLFLSRAGYRLFYTQREVPGTLQASSWYVPLSSDGVPTAAPVRIQETLWETVEMGASDSEFLIVVRRANDRIFGIRTMSVRNRRVVLGQVQGLPFAGQAPSVVAAAFHRASRSWGLLWTEGFLIDEARPGYLYGRVFFGRADASGRFLAETKIALSDSDFEWTASLGPTARGLVATDTGFRAVWSRDGVNDHFVLFAEVPLDGARPILTEWRTEVSPVIGELRLSENGALDLSYSVPATDRGRIVVRPEIGSVPVPPTVELIHPHPNSSAYLARSTQRLGIAYSESVRATNSGPARSELWFSTREQPGRSVQEVRITAASSSPCGLVWNEGRFALPFLRHDESGRSIAQIAFVAGD